MTTTTPTTSETPIKSDEDDYDGYDIWDDYFEIPEQKNFTSIKSVEDKENGLLLAF